MVNLHVLAYIQHTHKLKVTTMINHIEENRPLLSFPLLSSLPLFCSDSAGITSLFETPGGGRTSRAALTVCVWEYRRLFDEEGDSGI